MRIVIVTGMSGAGKSTVLKIFEDIGYYCVDNMPIALVEKFVELAVAGMLRILPLVLISGAVRHLVVLQMCLNA